MVSVEEKPCMEEDLSDIFLREDQHSCKKKSSIHWENIFQKLFLRKQNSQRFFQKRRIDPRMSSLSKHISKDFIQKTSQVFYGSGVSRNISIKEDLERNLL